MYKPQQKELRYHTAWLMEKYRDELEVISTSWKEYHNENGELVAVLPDVDYIFK